ncbi:hypothetical protein [Streptomyces sp. NPDC056883]
MKAVNAVALVVAIVGGLWLHFAGPCSLWSFSRMGDLPARCVMAK